MAAPTAYWRNKETGGIARWYWPESTDVEVRTSEGWAERPLFLDLNENPDWEKITEDEASAAATA